MVRSSTTSPGDGDHAAYERLLFQHVESSLTLARSVPLAHSDKIWQIACSSSPWYRDDCRRFQSKEPTGQYLSNWKSKPMRWSGGRFITREMGDCWPTLGAREFATLPRTTISQMLRVALVKIVCGEQLQYLVLKLNYIRCLFCQFQGFCSDIIEPHLSRRSRGSVQPKTLLPRPMLQIYAIHSAFGVRLQW